MNAAGPSSFEAWREAARQGELAAQSRATLRDRINRVRAALMLALQAAIAAGLAWFISHNVLGHYQPFFAPIAAVVVLAVSVGQRMRRAIEIVAGNAVGILLGEALILTIGRGAWQVALVVLLAILVAVFAGGSASLVAQAASSASLVATLVPVQHDYFFSRFIDAVVGGGVGLAVMALLLPLNPLTVVGRAAAPVLTSLQIGLEETADGLERKDKSLVAEALQRLRDAEAQLRAYNDAVAAGREISTVAPLRWRKRDALAQYVDAGSQVARALRNSRVLARRAIGMISDGETIPAPLIAAVRSLAESVKWLQHELAEGAEPVQARAAAVRAVRASAEAYDLTPPAPGAAPDVAPTAPRPPADSSPATSAPGASARRGATALGFSGSVVVAQIRSAASDLIVASGLSPEEAHGEVRAAARMRRPAGG